MDAETISSVKPLPLLIEHSPINDPKLGVVIRGEARLPRLAEPIQLPEDLFKQAEEIGEQLFRAFGNLPKFLTSFENCKKFGISEEVYQERIMPFLKAKHRVILLGADAVVDSGSNLIKVVEINTQPQVLGRYDQVSLSSLSPDDPNAFMSPAVKALLEEYIVGESAVIISHPSNGFHNHHLLFGEQIGVPVTTLQDLQIGTGGEIIFNGKPIKCLIKQCSMNAILKPSITDPRIVQAIREGRVELLNGPLAPFLGDKALLPLFSELGADITKYLPRMRTIRPDEEIDIKNYKGWWIKGESRGESEMTLPLTEDYMHGWRKAVITEILRGHYQEAEAILKSQKGSTAERFLRHVQDFETLSPGCFLLQENIPPQTTKIADQSGSTQILKTMLRMYFVPNSDPSKKPHVFLEILASPFDRVSAAGFSVPVMRAA